MPADSPLSPVVLHAEDLRRIPILGAALGMAVGAAALAWIESGPFVWVLIAGLWLAVMVAVLAVLPIANTLTIDRDGFRIRRFGIPSRLVPWPQVRTIEAGEGWAGSNVLIELAPDADRGWIVGLPRDADLERRALSDSYGRDPQELAELLVRFRDAATATRP